MGDVVHRGSDHEASLCGSVRRVRVGQGLNLGGDCIPLERYVGMFKKINCSWDGLPIIPYHLLKCTYMMNFMIIPVGMIGMHHFHHSHGLGWGTQPSTAQAAGN